MSARLIRVLAKSLLLGVGLLVGISLTHVGEAIAKPKNPLKIMIVKFKNGLTAQQMRDTVTQAGGEITSDLSRINAVAVVSEDSNFARRIAANPYALKVFEDKLSIKIPRIDVAPEDAGITGLTTYQF